MPLPQVGQLRQAIFFAKDGLSSLWWRPFFLPSLGKISGILFNELAILISDRVSHKRPSLNHELDAHSLAEQPGQICSFQYRSLENTSKWPTTVSRSAQTASPAGIWAGQPSQPCPSQVWATYGIWLGLLQDLTGARPGQPRLPTPARMNPARGPYESRMGPVRDMPGQMWTRFEDCCPLLDWARVICSYHGRFLG